jgi:hypothetical protein
VVEHHRDERGLQEDPQGDRLDEVGADVEWLEQVAQRPEGEDDIAAMDRIDVWDLVDGPHP